MYVLELPKPDPAGISDKEAISTLESIPVLCKHAFAISCCKSSSDSTDSDMLYFNLTYIYFDKQKLKIKPP